MLINAVPAINVDDLYREWNGGQKLLYHSKVNTQAHTKRTNFLHTGCLCIQIPMLYAVGTVYENVCTFSQYQRYIASNMAMGNAVKYG